uniref:G-protein coupled receptors family 1 profile domain-containing protein n=1 Tax=Anas platyrhynchos platyrhynchos TaxID=8840 RepID=A0A493TYF6_ANAPP
LQAVVIDVTRLGVDLGEEEEEDSATSPMHVLSMVVYSVACLLGVTGNGLVIWIAGFKMKKTVNSVWFLNLAIADFIFTFFLPLSIAYTALGFHWPFGKLLCKLNSTIAFLNMFASVFLLTVISMDRCVSVAFPVWSHNRRSPELAARIALGTWVLALLLSSPYLVFRDTVVSSRNVTSCYNNFALSDDYTSEFCLTSWAISKLASSGNQTRSFPRQGWEVVASRLCSVPMRCRTSQQAHNGCVGLRTSSGCFVGLLGETKHVHRAVLGSNQNVFPVCQA